jgi:cytochrome b pre-mRNA-processing protein 3
MRTDAMKLGVTPRRRVSMSPAALPWARSAIQGCHERRAVLACLMGFLGLIGVRRHERAGFALYTSSVQAARDPLYFERLAVPDTLDGRFDLIGLFASLLIRRLRGLAPPGPALAQAVFDAMFADMDFSLREIGVGEMSVGKKMRVMWEAFHGRAMAYEAALAAGDVAALAAALGRNVWRGATPDGSAAALARAAMAQDRFLAAQDLAELRKGRARFLPAGDALAGTGP